MAVSCAQLARESGQKVVAEASLRYSPAADFTLLGHNAPHENRKGGSRGIIEFIGMTDDAERSTYTVEIYKARNHHNIGIDRRGDFDGFGDQISNPQQLFSIYVPGLSGVPSRETVSGYASVFQRAAGGEANLVLRNIIRLISEQGLLSELETAVEPILGPTRFRVNFDERHDIYLDVSVQIGGDSEMYVPIDLCGTGVIQVTQIFAYVILFRPKILLVDEPDSHLHPTRQSLLSKAFLAIAEEFGCTVMISTHSRHLLSSAPEDASIIWLRDGSVADGGEGAELTKILMDIGALDQIDSRGASVILCTEDEKTGPLESCIASLGWSNMIRVISYNGVNNAGNSEAFQSMASLMDPSPTVVVHRDRDFLTDEEVERWAEPFTRHGIRVLCPRLCDIEAHYADPVAISDRTGQDLSVVEEARNKLVADNNAELRAKYRSKRRAANQTFWQDGGGPATASLLPDDAIIQDHQVYGKDLLKWMEKYAKKNWNFQGSLISGSNYLLCQELSESLSDLVQAPDGDSDV